MELPNCLPSNCGWKKISLQSNWLWVMSLMGVPMNIIMIMTDVIHALQTIEDAPKFFATDFCHQYTQYGGYGNIWGLVTCGPDGTLISFPFFLKSSESDELFKGCGRHNSLPNPNIQKLG